MVCWSGTCGGNISSMSMVALKNFVVQKNMFLLLVMLMCLISLRRWKIKKGNFKTWMTLLVSLNCTCEINLSFFYYKIHREMEAAPNFCLLLLCISKWFYNFNYLVCFHPLVLIEVYNRYTCDYIPFAYVLLCGKVWYVANVSIIFDAPCLFYINFSVFCLYFVAHLCIFWN
jgi:hypothetical protein